jgi:hypothetical protein
MNFGEIIAAVESISKQFTGKKQTQVEYLINMVYLNEIMSMQGVRPFFWLINWAANTYCVPPSTITAITQANPGVVTTIAAHKLTAGDIVHFFNISGMTELNGMMSRVITVPSTTTFTTSINTTTASAYTSGGNVYHRGITLPIAVDRVLAASWNEYPIMEMLSYEQFEADTTYHNKDGLADPPTHFMHGKGFDADGNQTDQILWSPAPNDQHLLRYWYEISPDRLEEDDDVPLLPARFHEAIVAGAVARLAKSEQNVGVEKTTLWPSIYQSHLAALKNYNERYWANVEHSQQVRHFLM